MKSRSRLSGSIWFVCQPILLNAISVPVTAFIYYRLGKYNLGEWATAAGLIAAASFISNLGLRTLFIRDLSRNPDSIEQLLGTQLALRCNLSLAAGVVAALLALVLHYPAEITYCVLINFVGLVLSTLATVFTDVLQSQERFAAITTVNFASGILLTVASLLAVVHSTSPVQLSLSYLVGPVVSICVLAPLVAKQTAIKPDWSWERHRELLRAVKAMTASQALSAIQERVEQLTAPRLVGIAQFGLFTGGSRPANRLSVIPDGVATVYFPRVASAFVDNRENANRMVVQLFTLSITASLATATLITILAHAISLLIFRQGAAQYSPIIQATVWALPLQGLLYPLQYALQAGGWHAAAAQKSTAATALNIAVSVLLVYLYRLPGACASLVLRPLLSSVALLPLFARMFPGLLRQVPAVKILACCSVMAACMVFALAYAHSNVWIEIIVGAIVGPVALTISLFLMRLVSVEMLRTSHS